MTISDKKLVEKVDKAIAAFRGDSRRLSNAIGYLMLGRQFGWRAMFVMYDKKSIKDYEKLLDFDSREFFPEVGPRADKSLAYSALQNVTNFWKAVKGEIPGVRSTEIQ